MPALAYKSTMIIPCGKFKGKLISSLPTSYLRWIAKNWRISKPIDDYIKVCAEFELQWREKNGVK